MTVLSRRRALALGSTALVLPSSLRAQAAWELWSEVGDGVKG